MSMDPRIAGWLAYLLLTWFSVAPLHAQEAPVEEEQPAAAEDLAEPDSPAVAAILATNPTTPAECIRAIQALVGLGRAEAAKPLLQKVIESQLDQQQLADLGERFGVPAFLDLAGQSALLPESAQLADAVSVAVKTRREGAERITVLIAQLQDPSEQKRLEALAGLQEVRRLALGPLISVLADPARSNEYQNVRTVLAGMGRPARDALAAVLGADDPALKVQAILALAEMNDPKAAVDLFEPYLSKDEDAQVRAAAAEALKKLSGRVPTPIEAVSLLIETAKAYFQHRQPVAGEVDDRVEFWHWDAGARQCEVRDVTPADAARRLAARYAREAYVLAPDHREVLLLYLAAMLDVAAYANGLDNPLAAENPAVAEAEKSGPGVIDNVLAYAMEQRHPAAATVAAQLLGETGTADKLLYQGDRPAPLVLALQDPDRRLRLAALEAIVRLRPTKPYAGSSYVPSALAFFAAGDGVRKALVGGPSLEQARSLAGMLAAAGLKAEAVTSGKDLLQLAIDSPDYELAMIDVGIERPGIDLLLQQLRRDPRTALLRVGLVARAGHAAAAERLARRDPMCMAFARPHDEQAVRWQLDRLAGIDPEEFVDIAVRQRQAVRALDLLGELIRSPEKLYNLRCTEAAMLAALRSHDPAVAVKAAGLLAEMNSAEIQQALVETASRSTLPLEVRTAAACAFRENTQRHGILLTTVEIRRQYDRYNASEQLDAPTQHVLGLILDCLEAPSKANK